MSKLRILPYHPATVKIDGEEVRIRVARFTIEAYTVFRRDFLRADDPPSQRALLIRQPGDEEARQADAAGKDIFVIPDSEIAKRRLAEMTAEVRAAFDQQRAEEEDFAASFIRQSVTEHVSVEPGEIEITVEGAVEGPRTRDLTSGADLVQYFGGRREILWAMVLEILVQNTADEKGKNAWRSRFASGDSSSARGPEVDGAIPAPPATPAASEASVESGAAMASTEGIPSGSMAMSS